jgi:hypothetical protein
MSEYVTLHSKDGKKTWVYNFQDKEPNKSRNMRYYQAEGTKRNQESNFPKRLYMSDLSADEANRTTDILDLHTKQRYRFKEGTTITEVHAFAGKGTSRVFRDAQKYARRYPQGGNIEDWQHCSGQAQITNGKKVLRREIHWVQGKDGKMHEAFIKVFTNNLKDHK